MDSQPSVYCYYCMCVNCLIYLAIIDDGDDYQQVGNVYEMCLGNEKTSETCRQEVLEHFDAPDAADKHFVIELVNWFFFF